ncbi:MAG: amidohydrolase family protein, partial [Candidatus Lokiarchaeota archaeon]|nr:amidohydrolase family protein [Candidatus Lokiarchaeota archaeon]MBD3202367.1 amidohydrolase family protein [Candidatus Lokiarchaeota archaeon]
MEYNHFDFKFVDCHTHFFPPKIFKAIWDFFEMKDEDGIVQGWYIHYKLSPKELVQLLTNQNVEYFTTLNYAHKKGVANYINQWTKEFCGKHPHALPFGCIWAEDENLYDYVYKYIVENDFLGIKIQPLVQKFYLNNQKLDKIYRLLIDQGKWLSVHIGTAPYRNKYVGYKIFIDFIQKYPNMKVIVAHMGAFEYKKFFSLLDKYEHVYLDTAMIFIPNNIFPERKSRQPNRDQLISFQDRILFGSDFPNIPYEYNQSTKGLLKMNFQKDFYKKIFYENAKKLF